MLSLAAFSGYILVILFLSKSLTGILCFIPPASFLIFYEFYLSPHLKKNLLLYLLVGILFGTSFGIYSNKKYSSVKIPSLDSITSSLVQTTSSFYYFNTPDNIRFKVKKSTMPDLFLFDRVDISCQSIKKTGNSNLFQKLEGFNKISFQCIKPGVTKIQPGLPWLKKQKEKLIDLVRSRLVKLPVNSYASGFLLADDKNLKPIEKKIFRRMGIAHLFSPSGLHMGLLYGSCYFLFNKLKTPVLGAFTGLFFCFLYLTILDFRISLLRAFLFLLIYLFLKLIRRKTEGRYILYSTCCLVELIFPFSCFSLSFILSFLITLSIILFYPEYSKIILSKKQAWKEHFSLTLSASIASSFLSLLFFKYYHPLSFLYNLLVVPVAGIYLPFLFVYLFIPFINFPVLIGDFVFKQMALLHYLLIEKKFPGLNLAFSYFWMFIFFLIFIYFIFLSLKKKYWYLRKHYFRIYYAVLALFFWNYFLVTVPKTAIYPYPYGVVYYNNKNLYFEGIPSKFYKTKYGYFIESLSFPYRKTFSSIEQISIIKNYYLNERVKIIPERPQYNGQIINGNCFFYPGRKRLKIFRKDIFKNCKKIYIITSAKKALNKKFFKKVFSPICPKAKLYYLNYFKWYKEDD